MSRLVVKKQKKKENGAPKAPTRESPGANPQASSAEITSAAAHGLIAKRSYEFYAAGGYREGHALDDWLEAEREILGHKKPL